MHTNMTALINIHLTEGLTTDEVGAFVDESAERHIPVDSVVYEALREKAQKIIKRRSRATGDGARPSLLNGMTRTA